MTRTATDERLDRIREVNSHRSLQCNKFSLLLAAALSVYVGLK